MPCKETNILRSEMDSHIRNQCLMTMVECSMCKQNVLRKVYRHENHFKNECPETIIDCRFAEFGCAEKMKRKDEKKHIDENVAVHMSLMADAIKSLQTENKELETNMQKIEKKTI